MPPVRLTLVRHGRSEYNARGLMNGDPRVGVGLDAVGRAQCEAVAAHLSGEHFALAVRTRFPRTAESLAIILAGRSVPVEVVPELDDVRMGDLEGVAHTDYVAWRRLTGPDIPPPGEGESRLDALSRYAAGFERLLDTGAESVLAVLHDAPIRFLANAARGADPLEGPVRHVANGEIVRLDDRAVRAGVARMRDRLGY